MIDSPLPGMPDPPPRLPVKRAGVRVTRMKNTKRELCDQCVVMIHVHGVAAAPYPVPARWRLNEPDGTVRKLCERHKEEDTRE